MKPVILVAIPHYRPGWKAGGPTRTIANLVEHLGDEFSFRILTLDRDAGDDSPFPGLEVDCWQRVGKAEVRYISPARRGLLPMARVLKEIDYDVLYLNSFFHPEFTVTPLLAYRLSVAPRKPIVLAPRGEFSDAALHLKAAKKSAFVRTAIALGLYSGVRWQASSRFEAEDIKRALPGIANTITIAGNLPAPIGHVSTPAPEREESHRPLRLVLLSRVSRMKNIAFAIEVVASSPLPVELDIWGALEDKAYWRECQALSAHLPEHVRAEYRGPAPFERVPEILSSYDLMFLPTQGENYGHVIAESLSAGTPVLISNRTPWRNLEQDGAGWDLPIDQGPEPFHRALAEARRRRDSEGAAWRGQVRSYAARVLLTPAMLEANRRLFAFD